MDKNGHPQIRQCLIKTFRVNLIREIIFPLTKTANQFRGKSRRISAKSVPEGPVKILQQQQNESFRTSTNHNTIYCNNEMNDSKNERGKGLLPQTRFRDLSRVSQ